MMRQFRGESRRAALVGWLALALFAVLAPGCSSATSPVDTGEEEALTRINPKLRAIAKPCTDADKKGLLCLDLPVPLDHFGPANGKKIRIGFAIHPAPASTRKGVLINAAGGPGYSGLDAPDDYKKTDRRITAAFDIVHFDLRGVGRSGNLQCKQAAKAYYLGGQRSASPAEDAAFVAKSRTFARDCVAEMGIPESELQFYNTRQAVEDIEALRRVLGEDKVTLYGLSYGTQFMQTYTRWHPDHVRALVLDGSVDLTLGHVDYMRNLDVGVSKLLEATLSACASDAACALPFAGAPGTTASERTLAAYDAVAARLERAPVVLRFKLKSGVTERRTYARTDFDTTTFNAVGDPDGRRDLPRAVAAAFQRAEFRPLLDLSYAAAGIDPDAAGPAGTASADEGMSDAIYYAFTCNDYGHESPDEAARVRLYIDAGVALRGESSRVLSPFYGDLPCAFWPTRKVAEREAPLVVAGVPVMVVDATGDGACPFNMGENVFRALGDGFLVKLEGGKHVMYGRGNACADGPVSSFILNLTRPPTRVTVCEDVFVSR